MVSWTHPEKAVSRLNSDALVTQLPSSSRAEFHKNITKKLRLTSNNKQEDRSFFIPVFVLDISGIR